MTKKQKLHHVRTLWHLIGDELGMKFWDEPMRRHVNFKFDRAKRRLGMAHYKLPQRAFRAGDPTTFNVLRVSYSQHYAYKLVDSELEYLIEDTLRHEAAHIFNYVENGPQQDNHGARWRRWAVRCGANPQRTKCIPDELSPDYKWLHVCEACGRESGYYRKPTKRRSCGNCSDVWNPKYEMILKKV